MLRIEAEQVAEDGPGWCRLRLHGIEPRSGPVELLFRRAGASRNFLGRSEWGDSEEWLELPASREGDASIIRIGPPLTQRLGQVSTVEVRARIPGSAEQRTRLAWPRIVLPAENDAEEAKVSTPPVEIPLAAPLSQRPSAVSSAEPPMSPQAQAPIEKHRWEQSATRLAGIALAAILLLVSMAALLLVWRGEPEPARPMPAPAARAYTEESVRAFLAPDPDGPSATAEGALYEAAGHPDLALLLYRHAARRGEYRAAVAIGRMYDPDGFDPARSAFAAPDAEQAASFYEQGAEAGDAEAQYRLGRLLISGRTAGEADAERGALWLQRAARQGHAQARAALQTLGSGSQ